MAGFLHFFKAVSGKEFWSTKQVISKWKYAAKIAGSHKNNKNFINRKNKVSNLLSQSPQFLLTASQFFLKLKNYLLNECLLLREVFESLRVNFLNGFYIPLKTPWVKTSHIHEILQTFRALLIQGVLHFCSQLCFISVTAVFSDAMYWPGWKGSNDTYPNSVHRFLFSKSVFYDFLVGYHGSDTLSPSLCSIVQIYVMVATGLLLLILIYFMVILKLKAVACCTSCVEVLMYVMVWNPH